MMENELQNRRDTRKLEETFQIIASPGQYDMVQVLPAKAHNIQQQHQKNHNQQSESQQEGKIQKNYKKSLSVSRVLSYSQSIGENIVDSMQQIKFSKNIQKTQKINNKNVQDAPTTKQQIESVHNQSQKKSSKYEQGNHSSEDDQEEQKDYNEQIVFFLLVGWIIQFVLAKKDPSVCLDSGPSDLLTFRTWLWVDGSLTLVLSMFFTVLFYVKQVGCRNVFGLQVILKVPCFIFKVIWILIGLGIYLNNLNFDDCSTSVINFMSFFFITFFYVFSILMVRMGGQMYRMCKRGLKMKQIMRRILVQTMSIEKSIKPQQESLRELFQKQMKMLQKIEKSKLDQTDRQLRPIIKQIKTHYRRIDKMPVWVFPAVLSIGEKSKNEAQIKKYKTKIEKENKSQVVFFLVIGWCIEFVLAQKDHSKCLETLLFTVSFTFRDWLWIDGGGTLAYSIAYGLKKLIQRNSDNECLRKFFWLLNYASFLFKAGWICFGIAAFLWDLNFINCSDNLIQFMCLYFLTFLYIISFYVLYRLPEKISMVDKIRGCLIDSETFRDCFKENQSND